MQKMLTGRDSVFVDICIFYNMMLAHSSQLAHSMMLAHSFSSQHDASNGNTVLVNVIKDIKERVLWNETGNLNIEDCPRRVDS